MLNINQLIIREIHIKTIKKYHLMTIRNSYLKKQKTRKLQQKIVSEGEDVQNWNTVDRNAK